MSTTTTESIERVQQQLNAYMAANVDWLTDPKKGVIVASFNNLLTQLEKGNVTFVTLS